MKIASHDLPLIPAGGPVAAAMEKLLRYARFPCHLVLLGESGVGKTTFARFVHMHSQVARGPFVVMNVAGLPDDLASSELLGHERGAFTGAYEQHLGAFERAHEGTLFLDEIGKISIPIQKKILTVIEDGIVRRLGGLRDVPVRVRHIFAANESLEALVRGGQLLPEFEARLQFQRVRIPALRERAEDIPALISDLLRRHGPNFGYPDRPPEPSATLLSRLKDMRWPGNVRSLEHAVIRLLQDADGAVRLDEQLLTEELAEYCGPSGTAPPLRSRVEQALRASGGKVTSAATLLGCSRSTLYLWMHAFGLDPDDFRRRPLSDT